MSSQFRVDFSKFAPLDLALPQSFTNKKALKQKIPTGVDKTEQRQFLYVEQTKGWIEGFKTIGWIEGFRTRSGEKWVKFCTVLDKVIKVFMALLGILFPIAFYYLPSWAPWTALPFLLFLAYGQYKLQEHIANCKLDIEYVPFLYELTKSRSYRALQPISLADINHDDPRLKSDRMMQTETKRVAPRSASWLNEVVGIKSRPGIKHDLPDIEVPIAHSQFVAAEFAQQPHLQKQGNAVKEARAEFGKAALDTPEAFAKQSAAIENTLYMSKYPVFDVPSGSGSLRDRTHTTLLLYHSFCLQVKKMEELFSEAKKLKAPPNIGEDEITEDWVSHLEKAEEIKKLMQPLLELFQNKAGEAKDYIGAIKYIEAHQLRFRLNNLFETTRNMQHALTDWIKAHPLNRLKFFKKTLQEQRREHYLEKKEKNLIKEWMKRHIDLSDTKICSLPLNSCFHKKKVIKEWLARHPDCRYLTPFELCARVQRMNDAIDVACGEYNNQKDKLADKESLDRFQQEVLIPLTNVTSRQGSDSLIRDRLKLLFFQIPADPFVQEKLPKDPILRRRKIEELRLNERLKAIDTKMLNWNKGRVWGIRIPLIILLLVEAIFSIYVSGPWLFWGLAALTVVGEGISYYVNHRLTLMEKKKEGLKLRYILRDHPDIGFLPGSHPELEQLKEVQKKYGLDGVTETWARAIPHSEKVSEQLATPLYEQVKRRNLQFNPNPNEGAKIRQKYSTHLKEMCEAGSKKADRQLRQHLVYLESQREGLRNLDPGNNKKLKKEIDARLKACEAKIEFFNLPWEEKYRPKAKQFRVSKKLPRLSDFEIAAKKRDKVAAAMDAIADEMVRLEKKIRDLKEKFNEFKRFEKLLGPRLVAADLAKDQLEFLLAAIQGERTAQREGENIQSLLIAVRFQLGGVIQSMSLPNKVEYLNQYMQRLRSFSSATLYIYARALYMVNVLKSEYGNKAYVDALLAECRVRQKAFRKAYEERKIQFDRYNGRVEKLKKPESKPKPTPLGQLEAMLNSQNGKTEKDKAQFWRENQDAIRNLYKQLGLREQGAIWWHLPQVFRDELSGERLLTLCGYAFPNRYDQEGKPLPIDYKANKERWEGLKKTKEGKAFLEKYGATSLYRDIAALHSKKEEKHETWWKGHGAEVEATFTQIDPKRRKEVYDVLPPYFKDHLKRCYEAVVGDAIIDRIKVMTAFAKKARKPKVVFAKQWEENKVDLKNLYDRLAPYHKEDILQKIPKDLRSHFVV